jgi:hypothetical protein
VIKDEVVIVVAAAAYNLVTWFGSRKKTRTHKPNFILRKEMACVASYAWKYNKG